MLGGWRFLILGVLIGCQPKESTQGPNKDTLALSLSEEGPPCVALQRTFPPLSLPAEFPVEQAGEPFPPTLQEWWRKHLGAEAIYTPIGVWPLSPAYKLWVVEVIRAQSSLAYGVLVDSACGVRDTLVLSALQVGENTLQTLHSALTAEGYITRTFEKRSTTFSGESPQTTTSRHVDSYRIDRERARFMAL